MMHRKPSMIRKAATTAALAVAATTAVLGATVTGAGAATHHQHTAANDQRMCAAFNRWSNHDGRGDAKVWARWLPGTDGEMYRDGLAFAWAIRTGAPHPVLRELFGDVWADCNPDA